MGGRDSGCETEDEPVRASGEGQGAGTFGRPPRSG